MSNGQKKDKRVKHPLNKFLPFSRIQQVWKNLNSSLWFLPTLIIIGAVALAVFGIALDIKIKSDQLDTWPAVFGAGNEGSRNMLSAIAGSMITVLGVAFSITIVTLSLASSQYTPRILRNFMKDRINQTVLGVLAGIFIYCLIVLRTIRGSDEEGFVPSVSVAFSVLLAMVGIGFLILFIHHISSSIQANNIISSVASETEEAIDHLFPQDLGQEQEDDGELLIGELSSAKWTPIQATRTGYIQGVNKEALLDFSKQYQVIVRMEYCVGEFVVETTPFVSLSGSDFCKEEAAKELKKIFAISRYRTVSQDAAFGIRLLVDIALKALSPGVNDTTTATTCIDYLTAILLRLALRTIEDPYRFEGTQLRVIVKEYSFKQYVHLCFDQIRHNAKGNVAVIMGLLRMVEVVSNSTHSLQRRKVLYEQVSLITETALHTLPTKYDKDLVEAYKDKIVKQKV